MHISRRSWLSAGLALPLLSRAAFAQSFPDNRPIRWVVPFPPGGQTDSTARLTAQGLATALPANIVVENRAGGQGTVGSDHVRQSPPDGHTLLLTTPNHTINAAFRTNMPYDTEKDFRAVSNVGQVPMLLVTHPSLPVTTFQGFIDHARKNPGKINVSSAGNGTLPHITMELLSLKEKFQVTNVPYRGAAPALADLVAGQVQAKLDNYTQSAQFIADRKLNLLAVTSARRLKQFPDVPAVTEQLPGFEGYLWMGILVPARTPDAVIQKLAAAIQRFVARPETQARFDKDGIEPVGNGPDAFSAEIAKELAQWRELAKTTKITVE